MLAQKELFFDSALPFDMPEWQHINLLQNEQINNIIKMRLDGNEFDIGDMRINLPDFSIIGCI